MKVCNSTWFLGIFLSSAVVKDATALRGGRLADATTASQLTATTTAEAHDHRILNAEQELSYEHVAAHKGGLFGAVKVVAARAQAKNEAKYGAQEETEPPTDIAQGKALLQLSVMVKSSLWLTGSFCSLRL